MASRSSRRKRIGTPISLVAIFLLFFLALSTSPVWAQTPGLNGFALCTSKAPKESGYVDGAPVYLSEVFQVYANNADYEKAYAAFLKQKYNFSGPLNCSVAYTKDDQVRTLNQRVQVVGSLAVRTGWVFANASAAPAAPKPVTQNNATPTARTYYVCTYSYYKTRYISDVSGPDDAADALTKITTAFGSYVRAKYNLANAGSASCVYSFSAAQAQAQVSQFAKPTSDGTPVLTGWKYGDAPANAAPSQPAAPATTTTAAAQNIPAPAGGGAYWLCMLAAGDTHYYSDLFTAPAGTTLANVSTGFRQFVKSKYNPTNALPPRCFNYGASQQQAQSSKASQHKAVRV